MHLIFRLERDKDFLKVCEGIRKKHHPDYISVENIAKMAVMEEAQSFYLDITVIENVVYYFLKHKTHSIRHGKVKHDLYCEIYKRYLSYREQTGKANVAEFARMLQEQTAPRFYLSRRYAMNLYYNLLKKK
jgi:hypothetical protein